VIEFCPCAGSAKQSTPHPMMAANPTSLDLIIYSPCAFNSSGPDWTVPSQLDSILRRLSILSRLIISATCCKHLTYYLRVLLIHFPPRPYSPLQRLLIFVPISNAVKTDSLCDLSQNFATTSSLRGRRFQDCCSTSTDPRCRERTMSFAPSTIATTASNNPFVGFQIVCLL
jgi:hypothetical protein